jgi:hypothetical protein
MAADNITGVADADPVAALLAAGKCKQAVELAKERHKALRTPASERQLVDAYLARIAQFQAKAMVKDAETLIALVQERFPTYRDELVTLKIRAAAGSGRIDDLVAPLARADTPPEVRATIEATLRQTLTDLPALANTAALPADHSLRVAAAALHRAFEAVTTGPVEDAALALPEVSFRSPLAGWKLLVRAIAAFHRDDDDTCRRALEPIAADAAVRRLAPALLGMVDRKPATAGLIGALQAKVALDDAPLLSNLSVIESALRHTDPNGLQSGIRTAVRLCAAAHPDRLDRLQQHIVVACDTFSVPFDVIRAALPAAPRADAYLWRLLAREIESVGGRGEAAVYWQRFAVHGIAEKLFPARGLVAGEVYRRAATLLATESPRDLAYIGGAGGPMALVAPYYVGQPDDIAKLVPKPEQMSRRTALSADAMFAKAVDCDADPETFRHWWQWAKAAHEGDKRLEDIAKVWRAKRPTDVEPLLHLGQLAEDRNALKMALGHLSAAEAIDPMNPSVRRARLRLTVSVTLRHLRDKKPHLAEKDIADLEQLPGLREGDRAGCLAALRAAWLALTADAAAEAAATAAVVAQLGPVTGRALLDSIATLAKLPAKRPWAGLSPEATPAEPRDLARAEVVLVNLSRDTGLQLTRPVVWNEPINAVLKERPCPLSAAELIAIGESALERQFGFQAYLASAAGLNAAGGGRGNEARFLLIRGCSLSHYYADRRASQCLRAALELARQGHDAGLIDQILTAIERHPHARRALADGRSGAGITPEQLADVLKHERSADAFPTTAAAADEHVVLPDPPIGRGASPYEMFDDGYEDDDEDDDDDDDWDDGDDADDDFDLGFGSSGGPNLDLDAIDDLIPPALRQQVMEIAKKLGRPPTPNDMMKKNPKLLMELLAAMAASQRDTGKPGGAGRKSKGRK